MKKYLIVAMSAIFAVCLMTFSAGAQTGASGSASGNASVTPGQASAGANANQSAQTPNGSANVGAGANANATQQQGTKQDKDADNKNPGTKGNAVTNSSPAGSSSVLNSGTTLQAELAKSVDAKKAKPGDEVTAKLTQDVKADGKVVLHKGSKLVGHVTEAQGKTKDNAESKLGIVFDKAVLKGGQEVAFNGAVQALAPPVQGSLSAAGSDAGNLDAGPGMARGTMTGGAGGRPLGGVASTVGNATSGVGNTAGSVAGSATGAVGGNVNNTAGTAVHGAVNSTSHGVIGMEGLTLSSASANSAQGSVISSATNNVKLDAGTQMVLQVVGAAK
jgi:hypothetical protein